MTEAELVAMEKYCADETGAWDRERFRNTAIRDITALVAEVRRLTVRLEIEVASTRGALQQVAALEVELGRLP